MNKLNDNYDKTLEIVLDYLHLDPLIEANLLNPMFAMNISKVDKIKITLSQLCVDLISIIRIYLNEIEPLIYWGKYYP